MDAAGLGNPEAPPDRAGVPATWIRQKVETVPEWATRFWNDAEQNGLAKALGRPDQMVFMR
jgi:hypothetical protein